MRYAASTSTPTSTSVHTIPMTMRTTQMAPSAASPTTTAMRVHGSRRGGFSGSSVTSTAYGAGR